MEKLSDDVKNEMMTEWRKQYGDGGDEQAKSAIGWTGTPNAEFLNSELENYVESFEEDSSELYEVVTGTDQTEFDKYYEALSFQLEHLKRVRMWLNELSAD
jgi:uncharacterized protein YpmS